MANPACSTAVHCRRDRFQTSSLINLVPSNVELRTTRVQQGASILTPDNTPQREHAWKRQSARPRDRDAMDPSKNIPLPKQRSAHAGSDLVSAISRNPKTIRRQGVKQRLSHYWLDPLLARHRVQISADSWSEVLAGQGLTARREERQLKRTMGDLLRVVPFIIIPAYSVLGFALC
jgi:hypothetical protein